jgi:hypothetical protein
MNSFARVPLQPFNVRTTGFSIIAGLSQQNFDSGSGPFSPRLAIFPSPHSRQLWPFASSGRFAVCESIAGSGSFSPSDCFIGSELFSASGTPGVIVPGGDQAAGVLGTVCGSSSPTFFSAEKKEKGGGFPGERGRQW